MLVSTIHEYNELVAYNTSMNQKTLIWIIDKEKFHLWI
jgi:hypothetical protein